MCGFCLEAIMIEQSVQIRMDQSQAEMDNSFLLYTYLRSYDDVMKVIEKIRPSDFYDECVDVIFCRLYEQFIIYGYDEQFYRGLVTTLGEEKINAYFGRRSQSYSDRFFNPPLQMLADPGIYENKANWETFIQGRAALAEASAVCLNQYFEWWLVDKNRGMFDEQIIKFSDTRMPNPVNDIALKSWKFFCSVFPMLFFALTFLAAKNRVPEVIRHIALTIPDGAAVLEGNDLWLQRKAFIACVKVYGVGFLTDNLPLLRPQVICQALLSLQFNPDELEALNTAVMSIKNQINRCEKHEYEMISDLISFLKEHH